MKPRPSDTEPAIGFDQVLVIASVTPVSSPSKRLALPTRLTPSERKVISARHSTTAPSSPERYKEVRPTLDSTPFFIFRSLVRKPPFNSSVDFFLPPVLEEAVAHLETEEMLNVQGAGGGALKIIPWMIYRNMKWQKIFCDSKWYKPVLVGYKLTFNFTLDS